MYDKTYTIRLSGRTPLYAPLYLAKQEQLTPIFRWIRFDFGADRRGKGTDIDPLFYELLSQDDYHDTILAVGDPYRLRDKEIGQLSDASAPVVVGGLIKSTCLWLVGHEDGYENGKKFEECFDQVVVHSTRMTSFALIASELLKQEVPPERAGQLVFPGALLGQEAQWAGSRNKPLPKGFYFWARRKHDLPCAYITTDIADLLRADCEHRIKRRFLHETEYQNHLLTGLITHEKAYSEQQHVIEEIIEGVAKAVTIINDDSLWAAKRLYATREWRSVFHTIGGAEDINQYLEGLNNANAYNSDPRLQVDWQCFNKALQIHKRADEFRREVEKGLGLHRRFESLTDEQLIPFFDRVLKRPERYSPLKSFIISVLKQTQSCLAANPDKPRPRLRFTTPENEVRRSRTSHWLAWLGFPLALLSLFYLLLLRFPYGNRAEKVLTIWAWPTEFVENLRWVAIPNYTFIAFDSTTWKFVFLFFLPIIAGVLLFRLLSAALEGIRIRSAWKPFFAWLGMTFAIICLVYALTGDWNTIVGTLVNWTAVWYLVYKYYRAHSIGSSPVSALRKRWRAICLYTRILGNNLSGNASSSERWRFSSTCCNLARCWKHLARYYLRGLQEWWAQVKKDCMSKLYGTS